MNFRKIFVFGAALMPLLSGLTIFINKAQAFQFYPPGFSHSSPVPSFDQIEASKKEVLAIMTFLEAWWQGTAVKSQENYRLNQVLMPTFSFVTPDGSTLDYASTLGGLYESHGSMPDLTKIEDLNFKVLYANFGVTILSYDEYHHFEGGRVEHLVTTSVLERVFDAPNGVKWLRVQETLKTAK